MADRRAPLNRVGPALRPLTAALQQSTDPPAWDAASWRDAHGLPGPSVPDDRFTIAPLDVAARGRGVLVLGDPVGEPLSAELAGFVRRVTHAVSAAIVFEDRAALAARLRSALRPAAVPAVPGLDIGAAFRPAGVTGEIGGDFYDVATRPGGGCTVWLGDVSGKGAEAAVLAGQIRQTLRTAALLGSEPDRALEIANQALMAGGGDDFVTVLYGVVQPDARGAAVRLANGGHPPPLVLRHDGGRAVVEELPVRGTVVGMLPEARFGRLETVLAPGESLVLFTDGTTEARGPGGMLGVAPIIALLADSANLTAQAVADRLVQCVLDHLGGSEHDDIAILVLRCRP